MGYFVSNALQSNFGINFQSLALAKIEECLVKFSKKVQQLFLILI